MGSAGEVVEISSDEEDVPMARKPIDDWLGKLLNDEADEINVDDFSDLMVMGELSAPPVPPQKMAKPGGCADDDDEDCVVLDGDPDKAITVREEKGDGGDSSSDELQIVGGKGPVFVFFHFIHSNVFCAYHRNSMLLYWRECKEMKCFISCMTMVC
jgi:hypothetical protein